MKHKKSLLTVILVVILLASAVSGTIAYLMMNTGTVTNTFQPAKVDTEIVEGFDSMGNKNSIVIKNKEESSSAFVRMAVVGNWCDNKGKIVKAWQVPTNLSLGDNWKKHTDGYFYYTKALAAGEATTNLLNETSFPKMEDDLLLEVTVMQQAIQSEPKSAVTEKWGVDPTDLE